MAATALIYPPQKHPKQEGGRWLGMGLFSLMTLIPYQEGKSFIEVTRRVPHTFHWPYISLGHIPTLWQRGIRFLGLICTRHYSASRRCTFSQNVGSISMGETGNGCWVDDLDFCHIHSSRKSLFIKCQLCTKGPCWVVRNSHRQDR